MNKKILFLLFISILLIILPSKVEAMKPYEFSNRKECEKIELAIAKEDGSLEKVECFDEYSDANKKMSEINNDNLVIIENGNIINAKYGLVDYDVDFYNKPYYQNTYAYVNIYADKNSNSIISYIRTASLKADDAVLLDFDYTSKRVKIKVSGVTGWINEYDGLLKLYTIVPISWVNTAQYYIVDKTEISHYYPANVYDKNASSESRKLDIKPEMLNEGKYYSYDGHYFYTDLKTLITDYKNNNYNHAVNMSKPYYNYYQYLSFRTKTNYNAKNINDYISKRTGNNKDSKLYNTGEYFIWVQEHYGVNALAMLAIGINESGWGKSELAMTKNNLFGLNAVDATPGESSDYFASVEDCIKTYGYRWMSYWYLQPGDFHFKGSNLGNKKEGLNVKYASDPFWSEKAISYYYDFDKSYGFQDRNNYL